ncbi:MAG: hypothetical protein AB1705_16130 [Verrucomicrobiota bacterium]
MKNNARKLAARFTRPRRFEVTPRAGDVSRESRDAAFTRMKHQLLVQLLDHSPDSDQREYLRQSLHEAEALAFATAYPLLVFPVLAEEKATEARVKVDKQRCVRKRSERLISMAA